MATKKIAKKAAKKVTSKIDKVKVRLYRGGTGDCFLLQFKAGATVKCNMMIDCGCILGGRKEFEPWVNDIKKETKGIIDILVVTHQHADHINGFQNCADLYDQFTFKKVWFSWTEDETDDLANDLRQNHSKTSLALQVASLQLTGLADSQYYESLYTDEYNGNLMLESKKHFIHSLAQVNSLNAVGQLSAAAGKVPSMQKLFADFNVIKDKTVVEFLNPGDLLKNVAGLPGMNVFVLGPPRDSALMDITEEHGESFEKRENKSSRDFALAAALLGSGQGTDILPFESEYELVTDPSAIKNTYEKGNDWRRIDHDWLFSSGGMALRYEGSINNTSLALAFQFEDSERVLIFPGDAEFGNWKSWHMGLEWNIKVNNKAKKVNAEYLLNNAVFYKIGHHCSQNGSAKRLGVDMMTSDDLTAMAPLNFSKIQTGWLNTMPNDLLCAELIKKTKGKFYFSGDRKQILPNIKTDRVTVKKTHESTLETLNKKFDGKVFVECEIEG
jgi:hypothetical protein